jgi:hypothetical protein
MGHDTTPHKPTIETRAQVKALARFGIRQDKIALFLGIAEKTLRKHYRAELDIASAEADLQVANALFTNCLKGNVAAQIFWTKARMGWRESGPPPGSEPPVSPEESAYIDFTKLSTEALKEVRQAMVAGKADEADAPEGE